MAHVGATNGVFLGFFLRPVQLRAVKLRTHDHVVGTHILVYGVGMQMQIYSHFCV